MEATKPARPRAKKKDSPISKLHPSKPEAVEQAIAEGAPVVKTVLDRQEKADAAKATGTAIQLARQMDDALVCLEYALRGNRQGILVGAQQAVKALMSADRTFAQRVRKMNAEAGKERSIPTQPPISPEIVTLCGSTRFKALFEEKNQELTRQGKIVLSVGCFDRSIKVEEKMEFDKLHFSKIDISDAIYVLNPKGYIGYSTAREIIYAKAQKKSVYSLEPFDLAEVVKIADKK